MKPGSITVHPGSPDSYSVELTDGIVLTIGRKAAGSGDNRLVLAFPEVSGQHAEIRCKPGNWTIVDSGSTNGTTINGVSLAAGREYSLKDQDVIGIAQHLLVISIPQGFESAFENKPITAEQDQESTQFRVRLINATILVADIKHFSSLMEEYAASPEQVMQAAGKLFELLHKEIAQNYGQLEKIAGDAIMAYWHTGGSRSEIDLSAHQACLTALKLKQITAGIAANRGYWPFPNHSLALDMALASGPVASGALGRAQGNPALLGDTANLAFRLEKLIGDDRSGAIFVEGSTYDLTKDKFKFSFLGEFSIKGRQRTVNVYELVGS
jgi:class 3 adenylate cyclase